MNKRDSMRSLLLERLESRCLLAGGAFSFSHDHGDRGGGLRHDSQMGHAPSQIGEQLRPAEVRRHSEVEPSPHRSGRSDHKSSSRPRDPRGDSAQPVRPNDQVLRAELAGAAKSGDSQTNSNGGAREPIPPSESLPFDRLPPFSPPTSPIGTPAASNSDRLSGNDLVSDGPRLSPPQSVSAPPASGPVALAPPNAAPTPPGSSDAPSREAETRASQSGEQAASLASVYEREHASSAESRSINYAQAASSDESNPTVRWGFDSADGATHQNLDASSWESSERLADDEGGMIESSQSLGLPPMQVARGEQDAPWQLKSETVRKLRDMFGNEGGEEAHPNDIAIANWFSGPGGLISVQTNGAAMLAGTITEENVEIVLDATIGMHRAFELIASADSASTSDAIRDAVLAAIEGEGLPLAAPLQAATTLQLSAIAYPASAIVASSLVIANVRKKKLLRTTRESL